MRVALEDDIVDNPSHVMHHVEHIKNMLYHMEACTHEQKLKLIKVCLLGLRCQVKDMKADVQSGQERAVMEAYVFFVYVACASIEASMSQKAKKAQSGPKATKGSELAHTQQAWGGVKEQVLDTFRFACTLPLQRTWTHSKDRDVFLL